MKPFGTWSWASSYSLGGIIGCVTGGIALVALAPALPFLAAPIALISAIAIGGISGAVIQALNLSKGDFDNALNPNIKTRTVAEKVLTGAAITGYVALATITAIDVSIPTIEPTPTAIIVTTPVSIAQTQPAIKPTVEFILTPTIELNECALIDPSLSEIELINCNVSYEMVSCETFPPYDSSKTACSDHQYSFIPNIKLIITELNGVYIKIGENAYCSDSECAHIYTFTETGVIVEHFPSPGVLSLRAFHEIIK